MKEKYCLYVDKKYKCVSFIVHYKGITLSDNPKQTHYKLTRFKNAKIGIDRCPDHDAPTAVLVHFTYTIVCKAFITTSVDSNPPIIMVNVKPELARRRLFKAQRCL